MYVVSHFVVPLKSDLNVYQTHLRGPKQLGPKALITQRIVGQSLLTLPNIGGGGVTNTLAYNGEKLITVFKNCNSGPLAPWPLGPLAPWPLGPLAPWPLGPLAPFGT